MARIIDLVNAPSARSSFSLFSSSKPSAPPTKTATSDSSAPSKSKAAAARAPMLPLFVTCDPARDSPSVLKQYLAEFHESIVGLTGSWEQVRDMCKVYRVYFSTPEDVRPGEDYLVDHSIYFM